MAIAAESVREALDTTRTPEEPKPMDKRKHNQGPKAGAACAEAVKGNAQAREAHARVAARLRAADLSEP